MLYLWLQQYICASLVFTEVANNLLQKLERGVIKISLPHGFRKIDSARKWCNYTTGTLLSTIYNTTRDYQESLMISLMWQPHWKIFHKQIHAYEINLQKYIIVNIGMR